MDFVVLSESNIYPQGKMIYLAIFKSWWEKR